MGNYYNNYIMNRIQLLPILLLLGVIKAAPAAEKVDFLPYYKGIGNLTFNMWSGYLPVNGTTKQLHYIFSESQRDPKNDPLLIWFNGGPGCSSLLGFLQEHGPFVMDDETDFFFKNPWSWNNEASIIYLESPAGVGFSYCSNSAECIFTDDNTADDNLVAVQNWFQLFPEYASHDLYITGESYAGVYVPYLVERIDAFNQNTTINFTFNLKGFMVGNGVTNWTVDCDPALSLIGMYYGV
jgi:cathepsin A (carboxypeptidase C)